MPRSTRCFAFFCSVFLAAGCAREEPVQTSLPTTAEATTEAADCCGTDSLSRSKLLASAATNSVNAAPTRITAAKPGDEADPAGNVALEVVKYDQLIAAVKAHKGKVIVVDVWATFCTPCVKEFPNLVRLHHHYGKDGLVCMSVSVDDAGKKDNALKFLKKSGAAFPNYLLDEEADYWTKKWDIEVIPAVFVFGRDGKRAGLFGGKEDADFDYEEVELLARKLLRQ